MTSTEVASHYNAVRQAGIEERKKSKIYHLRNVNNWLKSMLINEALEKLKEGEDWRSQLRVLDIACGKGGDLRKWNIAHATSVVMADIADVSISQAKERYQEMRERQRDNIFRAQFIVNDCCNVDLKSKVDPSYLPVDLVSCQFALHYSFVDESSARKFVHNCVSALRPGGLFIGTLPDANTIMWSVRQNEGRWSNRVCSITYDESTSLDNPPLFGAKFHFSLDEQVNCPEYLAHFPLLTQLLEDEGMQLVTMERSPKAAMRYLQTKDGNFLLQKMSALKEWKGGEENGEMQEYGHVNEGEGNVGTLSQSEWEAFSMYLIFIFKKREVNEEGEREETQPPIKKTKNE